MGIGEITQSAPVMGKMVKFFCLIQLRRCGCKNTNFIYPKNRNYLCFFAWQPILLCGLSCLGSSLPAFQNIWFIRQINDHLSDNNVHGARNKSRAYTGIESIPSATYPPKHSNITPRPLFAVKFARLEFRRKQRKYANWEAPRPSLPLWPPSS